MAKKKSYDAYLRQQMEDLIDQLQLPNLYKQSLKERWLDQMIWADKKAAQSRRSYYQLRLIAIVGGVILPALVGISVQLGQDSQFFRVWFPPLTFVLSQVIAVSVAIEEFCKFGDRWRDYRKMAEDLKSEGWQYLQSSGPYEYGSHPVSGPVQTYTERSTSLDAASVNGLVDSLGSLQSNGRQKHQVTHLQTYAQFANRVESIIKNDVQSYISDLLQQQAKQDAEAQKVLAQAQSASSNQTLIAQLDSFDPALNAPLSLVSSAPSAPANSALTPVTPAPMRATVMTTSPPTPGVVGVLKVQQETTFKLSTQPSQVLPDAQKITVGQGAAFGLMACTIADQNHLRVTFNQGVGPEKRNTWFVYAPHIQIVDRNGQPAAPTLLAPSVAASAAVGRKGEIKLAVPYYSQRDNVVDWWRTCNTSSCAMVAKFLGAKISGDDEYYHYVTKYGDTTEQSVQELALRELGIKSTWSQTLDFDDLDQSLANGLPIVIGILHRGPLEAPDRDSGHMLVVIGRKASGDYIVHDPYGSVLDGYATTNGKGLVYSRQVLTCRWTPDGKGSGWGRLFYGNKSPQSPFLPSDAGSTIKQWTPPSTATLPIGSGANAKLASVAAGSTQGTVLITVEQLLKIAGPDGHKEHLRELAPAVNQCLEKYQINTPLRIAHFLAQVMHESGGFHYLREIWGPTDAQSGYEGREDLGNTQPGDGKRFMGRGLIQLTGRANYTRLTQAMNVDFLSKPQLLEQSPYAVLSSGWFWHVEKNLNPIADRDDAKTITRRINGGLNGYDDRLEYLHRAKSVLKC